MKYGDALPKDYNIPTSAFWLRKDLTQSGNPFKNVDIVEGDRVMDCGAYIGTFAAACVEQGATRVTCYEAAPKNAALLRENVMRYDGRVEVIEAAIVPYKDSHAVLTMSNFSGANSIVESPNRKKKITVKALNFRDELQRIHPTILKLDVEGAEYALLESINAEDLSSVRCLFVEFHPIEHREERYSEVQRLILEAGFWIRSHRLRTFTAAREL